MFVGRSQHNVQHTYDQRTGGEGLEAARSAQPMERLAANQRANGEACGWRECNSCFYVNIMLMCWFLKQTRNHSPTPSSIPATRPCTVAVVPGGDTADAYATMHV